MPRQAPFLSMIHPPQTYNVIFSSCISSAAMGIESVTTVMPFFSWSSVDNKKVVVPQPRAI